MANGVKGEVGFAVDGANYVLRFGVNTLIELEDDLGQEVDEIIAVIKSGPGLKVWRKLFWFGLHERHPDVTEAAAGALMDDCGGVNAASALVVAAFAKAFPAVPTVDPQGSAAETGEASPPRKSRSRTANGTGTSSSASGASSA